ncbi:Major facilitator superfamily [Carpediemonas membranifera]|uniref:Lysosomal dipeptide transporter MFSD1 n=1 Tax=Carpediemonas membranifera TaxID=201153 RepID=A0A8J6B0K2_9EUKA|nr:Major facilitator superfamily [Carpediemonas membranifera]|eukprot:KAG9395820.1 Major facilitator superfamily [Carpediemonas membranifera]
MPVFSVLSVGSLVTVTFLLYFVTDIPSGAGQYLLDEGLETTAFGVLTSIYGWVNMILPLFAGYMLDHFGRSRSYALFCACIAVGSVIFLLGVATLKEPFNYSPTTAFLIMAVGRTIFSVGGDSAIVSNDTILTAVLPSSIVATSITLSILVGRIASVVSMNAVPIMIDQVGLAWSMYAIMIMLVPFVVALVSASVFSFIATERRKKKNRAQQAAMLQDGLLESTIQSRRESVEKLTRPTEADLEIATPVEAVSPANPSPLTERSAIDVVVGKSEVPSVVMSDEDDSAVESVSTSGSESDSDKPDEADNDATAQPTAIPTGQEIAQAITRLHNEAELPADAEPMPESAPFSKPDPLPLWRRTWDAVSIPVVGLLLAVMCLPSMGFIAFGWTSVGQVILVARSGLSADVAARYVSVASLMALVSPLWAVLIDKFRKQLAMMTVASILSIAAFGLLLIEGFPPLVAMLLQGLAFSAVSPCCWSSIPLCIPHNKVGIVFGLMSCALNLGLGVTAIIAPAALEVSWKWSIAWFLGCAVFTLVVVILFMVYDFKWNEGRLWSNKRSNAAPVPVDQMQVYPEAEGVET